MQKLMTYTIYKICNRVLPQVYIGTTIHYKNRKAIHKYHSNHKSDNHLYNTIRENGGWDNWDMVIIEEYDCMSKRDAELRETFWIKHYENIPNTVILNTYKLQMGSVPDNSTCKWYYKHREQNMQIGRSYYYKNRDSILKRQRELRETEGERSEPLTINS